MSAADRLAGSIAAGRRVSPRGGRTCRRSSPRAARYSLVKPSPSIGTICSRHSSSSTGRTSRSVASFHGRPARACSVLGIRPLHEARPPNTTATSPGTAAPSASSRQRKPALTIGCAICGRRATRKVRTCSPGRLRERGRTNRASAGEVFGHGHGESPGTSPGPRDIGRTDRHRRAERRQDREQVRGERLPSRVWLSVMAMLPPMLPALRTWMPARNLPCRTSSRRPVVSVGMPLVDHGAGRVEQPLDRDGRSHAKAVGLDGDHLKLRDLRDVDQDARLLMRIDRSGRVADDEADASRGRTRRSGAFQLHGLVDRGGRNQ